MFDAVVLNGTVGAGKTTTAEALGSLLVGRGVSHAVLDIDGVRQLWPSPPGDPFQRAITLANVGAVARNYRAAGAMRLVLAGVVETAEDLADLRRSIGPWQLACCRLAIDPLVASTRLRRRHSSDVVDWSLQWHLDRSPELASILENAAVDDSVIRAEQESPEQLAEQVAAFLSW